MAFKSSDDFFSFISLILLAKFTFKLYRTSDANVYTGVNYIQQTCVW